MLGIPGFAPAGLALELRGYASFISQSRRIDTEVRTLGDTMGAVATRSQRLTQALGVLGTAFIAVGAGLTAALKPIVEASDELRRLDIMGRGVASSMAISTEAMIAEREELAQLDVTAVQALSSLNALTMMHLDFTKASDLATAALDIAAFTGEKVNKVYEDFTRAVTNASTLGLRAYKITATTERVFAAYAATLGKTARELTMVERRQAVLNYILAVSARVSGAWAATVETLWGQLQRLNIAAANLAGSVGQYLLPRLIELLKYANMLLQRFDALPESTKEVIVAFAAKAAVVLTVAGAVALLLPVLRLLTAAFFALAQILVTTVWGALKGTYLLLAALGPAGWVAAAAIAAVVIAIKANWLGLGDWFDREIGGWFTGVQTWAVGIYEGLVAPFRMANQEIRNITGSLSDEDFGFDWTPEELFKDFADQAKRAAKEALWAIQDVLFGLATRALDLARLLYPFEDAIERVRAAADLVVIPLERQQRALERQLKALEKIVKEEKKRAEQRLKELKKQEEALRELVKADQERLDYLDWEIFMEQQRNKVLGREASVRLLEMESQRDVASDLLARRQEELDVVSEARRAEKERQEDYQSAAEQQIEALQERIDALVESIDLEEERVLWAEENLRLEKARHVEARLALLAETRLWQEEQRQAQHALDIINRIPDAIRAIAEAWTFELPGVPTFPKPRVPEVPGLPEVRGAEQITPERPSPFRQWFQIPTPRERDEVSEGINKWLDDFFAEDTERAAKRRTALEARWTELTQAFETWIDKGVDWYAREVVAGWNRVSAAETKAMDEYAKAVVAGWQRTEKAWEEFKTGWGAFWGEVQKLGEGFWTGFTTWWGERWEEFKKAWDESGIKKYFTEEPLEGEEMWWEKEWEAKPVFPGLVEKVEALVTSIETKLGEAGKAVEKYFTEDPAEGEKMWWEKEWGPTFVFPGLVEQLETFGTIISTKAGEYYAAITEWVSQAAEDIGTKWEEFKVATNKWYEETGIPDIIRLGKLLVSKLIEAAGDKIEELWEDIKALGASIVAGITQGIEDKWEGFKSWIKGKVLGIIGAILGAIGASSPAKITEPIGVALIEGIQVGMQKALSRLTRGLQASVALNVARPLGQVSSVPATSTVTNYYYITHEAPSVSIAASYAREQSQASIVHDVEMLLAMA